MSSANQTAKLKRLIDEYYKNIDKFDVLSKIGDEYSKLREGDQKALLETLQQIWAWPALPAVFFHIIYMNYSNFEYLEEDQNQEYLGYLRAVIYLSAQFAESTSIAQEMIQLKYPLYFYPILKSRFTPDDVKSLILSLFIVLARKTDTQYFVKQELTSLLLL